MWKSLTILTILFAGAAATFRYFSTNDAKLEAELLERSKKNVVAAEDHLANVVKLRQETEDKAVAVNGEAEIEKKNLDAANAEKRTKEGEKSSLEAQIAEKKAKLADLEEQLKEIGNIEDAVAKSEELQIQTANVNQELFAAKEKFKNLIATREGTAKRISNLKDKETMQRSGQMVSLNARVSQSYDPWGFVVINAGGRQGVNSGTKLDVKRGGKLIGQLKVTNLEPNLSVCDVLSVTAEERIAPGDRVSVAEESKWDPEKNKKAAAAEAADGGAPAGAGAPEAPPAPEVKPPTNDDPFGLDPAPAPAAPAEDDDPFGLN